MIDQRTAPYAALFLRETLGSLAIAHLYWKFFIRADGAGLMSWWENLNNNGYPDWVVWYVLSAEFAGALLLIPGIYTRWVALYSVPLMVAAAQFWFSRNGFFFTTATGPAAELPFLWTMALLVQAGVGDGAYALKASPPFPFLDRGRTVPAE
jgi:putative oxidoreductase